MPASILNALSISHRHVIISFQTGFDGGYSQTITVEYRTGSGAFTAGSSKTYALGFFSSDELLVSDNFQAETQYEIRLVSDNQHPVGAAAISDVITVTTRGDMLMCNPVCCEIVSFLANI